MQARWWWELKIEQFSSWLPRSQYLSCLFSGCYKRGKILIQRTSELVGCTVKYRVLNWPIMMHAHVLSERYSIFYKSLISDRLRIRNWPRIYEEWLQGFNILLFISGGGQHRFATHAMYPQTSRTCGISQGNSLSCFLVHGTTIGSTEGVCLAIRKETRAQQTLETANTWLRFSKKVRKSVLQLFTLLTF